MITYCIGYERACRTLHLEPTISDIARESDDISVGDMHRDKRYTLGHRHRINTREVIFYTR